MRTQTPHIFHPSPPALFRPHQSLDGDLPFLRRGIADELSGGWPELIKRDFNEIFRAAADSPSEFQISYQAKLPRRRWDIPDSMRPVPLPAIATKGQLPFGYNSPLLNSKVPIP